VKSKATPYLSTNIDLDKKIGDDTLQILLKRMEGDR